MRAGRDKRILPSVFVGRCFSSYIGDAYRATEPLDDVCIVERSEREALRACKVDA